MFLLAHGFFFTNLPFLMVQLQMTFFCNILQHYQLLFVDFTWMSKVQVIQLFMLARKPSSAASQYFRTWSPKFSTQISGDCTPALGYCFW
jgi:hypothetical protein